MKYSILMFGILSIFVSCNNVQIEKNLNILCSKPITIPNNTSMIYNGIDTVINNIFQSKLKLIVYTDSIGCTLCGINKMFMWKSYLDYAKKYDSKLQFYFIFHSSNETIHNIRSAMMLNPINYPILIDKNGDFEKLNPHLPKNKAMHTFLLDENNKVILVGNPLYNKEIEKLFYKKTQELLSK